jgi:hypothetical protein
MNYDEPMTTSLLRALYAAADVCRRCEAGMRARAHPDADFVRNWLRGLGDTISNAASDASNKRATFDAVVDGVDPNGMPPPLTETVGERHRRS